MFQSANSLSRKNLPLKIPPLPGWVVRRISRQLLSPMLFALLNLVSIGWTIPRPRRARLVFYRSLREMTPIRTFDVCPHLILVAI